MTRYLPLVILAVAFPVAGARFVVSDRNKRCLRDGRVFVNCAYDSGRARGCGKKSEKSKKGKSGGSDEDADGDVDCAVDEEHMEGLAELALEVGMRREDTQRMMRMMINSAEKANVADDEGEPEEEDEPADCPREARTCPDGRIAVPDPFNDCELPDCCCDKDADEAQAGKDEQGNDLFKCCPSGEWGKQSPVTGRVKYECDGKLMGRNRQFSEACPGSEMMCTQEMGECPDGSLVSHNPNADSCQYNLCDSECCKPADLTFQCDGEVVCCPQDGKWSCMNQNGKAICDGKKYKGPFGKVCGCRDYETCSHCVENSCPWTGVGGGCRDECWSDVPCYTNDMDGTPEEICSAWENMVDDVNACSGKESCDECVGTTLPSDKSRTCFWFNDSSSCSAWQCGMMGCGVSTCDDVNACSGKESCEECVGTTLPSDESGTCMWFNDDSSCLTGCGIMGCGVTTCDDV